MAILESLNEYEQKAEDFLKKNNIKLTCDFIGIKNHWDADRPVYKCKVYNSENSKSYTFPFYASVNDYENGDFGDNVNESNLKYNILACLSHNAYSDPDMTFEDFCDEFGYEQYDEDLYGENKESKKIYRDVLKEIAALQRVFTEEQLEELSEIS